jgi:hypothetical protein
MTETRSQLQVAVTTAALFAMGAHDLHQGVRVFRDWGGDLSPPDTPVSRHNTLLL